MQRVVVRGGQETHGRLSLRHAKEPPTQPIQERKGIPLPSIHRRQYVSYDIWQEYKHEQITVFDEVQLLWNDIDSQLDEQGLLQPHQELQKEAPGEGKAKRLRTITINDEQEIDESDHEEMWNGRELLIIINY